MRTGRSIATSSRCPARRGSGVDTPFRAGTFNRVNFGRATDKREAYSETGLKGDPIRWTGPSQSLDFRPAGLKRQIHDRVLLVEVRHQDVDDAAEPEGHDGVVSPFDLRRELILSVALENVNADP